MPRANRNRTADTDGTNKPKRTQRRRRSDGRVEFAGWVNVSIPDDRRQEFTDFEASTLYLDALEKVLLNSHRLSVTYSDDEECFIANSFCNDPDSPNAGLMVSGRSSSAQRALAKVVYIHAELLPDDYSGLSGTGASDW